MTPQPSPRFNDFWKRLKNQHHIIIGNFRIGKIRDRVIGFSDGFYLKFTDVEKWSLSIRGPVNSYGIFKYYSEEEANLLVTTLYDEEPSFEEIDKAIKSLEKKRERRKYKGNPVVFRHDTAPIQTAPQGETHGN